MAVAYRREIDGLRALAVIPVILFHAGFPACSGGFVGVDVFFVISGYLITTIIVSDVRNGSFSLSNFYERRARRILPALFLVIVACVPFAWLWMTPHELQQFGKSIIATVAFVSNVFFWVGTGYFDQTSELKPLIHTWSLAIEEQFYLFFPALLLLIAWIGQRRLLLAFTTMAILSLALSQYGAVYKPSAAFFLLPTRAWELLLGSVLSLYVLDNGLAVKSRVAEVASAVGVIMIAASVAAFDTTTPFPGLYALPPTVATALVIYFGTGETVVGRALARKPVMALGLISYSAYLWHQPLFAFARLKSGGDVSSAALLGLVLVAFALASISWRYIETPFRKRLTVSRKLAFSSFVVCATVLVGAGSLANSTGGFERYYYNHRLTPLERGVYEIVQRGTGGDMYLDMGDNGDCNFWSKFVTPDVIKRFQSCSSRFGQATIVLGDSHAMNIFNALYRSDFGKFVIGISQGGCRPSLMTAACHYHGFDEFAAANKDKIKTIIFHQSGGYLTTQESRKRTIDYLTKLSATVPVVWLGPFPDSEVDFRDVRHLAANGFKMSAKGIEQNDRLDRMLQQITSATRAVEYLSLSQLLRFTPSSLLQDGCVIYRDRDHLSICGERLVGEIFKRTYQPRKSSYQTF